MDDEFKDKYYWLRKEFRELIDMLSARAKKGISFGSEKYQKDYKKHYTDEVSHLNKMLEKVDEITEVQDYLAKEVGDTWDTYIRKYRSIEESVKLGLEIEDSEYVELKELRKQIEQLLKG